MINIYKKGEKNKDNLTGIIEITNADDLNKPFLLCISAQNNNDKSIYGIIREGAQAARVNTTEEMAAGFKIDEMPIDFLGVRFKPDDNYINNYDELVDKIIYPYLIKNGKENIYAQASQMNFMTYCDGTYTYINIEKKLEEKLKRDGFNENEINSILKNMSLVALGTTADTTNLKSTSITLIDVNDNEIETPKTQIYKNLLLNQNKNGVFGTLKNNNYLYIFNGSGIHNIKEFFKNDNIAKPILCSNISTFLEASINSLPKDPTQTYIKYGTNSIEEVKSSLNKLDNELSYHKTKKYSKEEATLRKDLDESFKQLYQTKIRVNILENENQKKALKIESVTQSLKEFSSETTFLQVLIKAGLWQSSSNQDVFTLPSDKEIRELYENNLEENFKK